MDGVLAEDNHNDIFITYGNDNDTDVWNTGEHPVMDNGEAMGKRHII